MSNQVYSNPSTVYSPSYGTVASVVATPTGITTTPINFTFSKSGNHRVTVQSPGLVDAAAAATAATISFAAGTFPSWAASNNPFIISGTDNDVATLLGMAVGSNGSGNFNKLNLACFAEN